MQIVPLAGVLGSSLVSMFQNFGKSSKVAETGLAAVGKSAPLAGTGIKGVGTASRLAQLAMGPVGLILIGIGTVLTLVATNAFGVRDAFNSFGKALGDTFPFLKPLLDLIKGLAGAMGLLGPESEKAAAGLGKAWGQVVAQVSAGVKTVIDTITRIVGGVKLIADQIIAGDWPGVFRTVESSQRKHGMLSRLQEKPLLEELSIFFFAVPSFQHIAPGLEAVPGDLHGCLPVVWTDCADPRDCGVGATSARNQAPLPTPRPVRRRPRAGASSPKMWQIARISGTLCRRLVERRSRRGTSTPLSALPFLARAQ